MGLVPILVILVSSSIYIVDETKRVFVTRFAKSSATDRSKARAKAKPASIFASRSSTRFTPLRSDPLVGRRPEEVAAQ